MVITENASQMKRSASNIANDLVHTPDWEMDYILPAKDALRLQGLKLHVNILNKRGLSKFVAFVSTGPGPWRISVRPKQVKKPWGDHELGDVGSIVIVGEPGSAAR